jgi:hypothetical protein
MGTQQLPDGSFTGRLGDVVGYHWHNKHLVRAYVKPVQPNTPAQLAAREMFRRASYYAKISMQYSGRWGIFDTTKSGEYPIRLGLSRKALGAGDTGRLLMPFTPATGTPGKDATGILIEKDWPDNALITINFQAPITNFRLDCFIWTVDATGEPCVQTARDELPVSASAVAFDLLDPEFNVGDTVFIAACYRGRLSPYTPIGNMTPRAVTVTVS